jgi:hypothetical protein
MSIPSINGIGRVAAATADTPAPTLTTTASRQSPPPGEVEIDKFTQQPKPLRFPWLSGLSHQLESAAQQRPAFPAAPVLGDHVDKSA